MYWRSLTEKLTARHGEDQGNLIAIGIVRGPHGLDGRVKVESFSGELEHFGRLATVTLVSDGRQTEVAVEAVSGSAKALILKLDCANTIEEAQRLRGSEIWVPRTLASPIGPDEYYLADLCGCSVVADGAPVGVVLSVLDAGSRDMFEIELSDGRTVLVPFQDEFIGAVSIDSRRIELKATWVLE